MDERDNNIHTLEQIQESRNHIISINTIKGTMITKYGKTFTTWHKVDANKWTPHLAYVRD